jgi:SAM-dependent methyltransferase
MKKEFIEILLKSVNDEYEYLADSFSHTRQRQWDDTNNLAQYVKGGDKVLDWGCGNGRLYQLFEGKNISYLGIDNCRGLIEKAQVKYPLAASRVSGQAAIDWQVGSDIPYQSFDKIFAIASWHHLPGDALRQRKLEEFHNRLTAGGYLLLTTWNLKQSKYFWLWMKNNLRNIFTGYDWNDMLVPWRTRNKVVYRYYHSISKKRLLKAVRKAGFIIEECYYSNKGETSNWWSGKNLVLIAKKS